MAGIQAIRRKSLHEELATSLEALIVSGALAPGTKIPERDLCEQFNVSRTPMREALKVLANQGLVILETNRGAWVSQITAADLQEVFPVMGALEALSGELACQKVTEQELTEIANLQQQMMEHYENRDLDRYFEVNQKIHKAILDAARNPTLTSQYNSLATRVRRARYIANMSEDRWLRATQEHVEIMRCLSERDGSGLASILRIHLSNKMETVLDWLQKQEKGI